MTFLYQIFIHLFNFSIHVASLFSKKANLWVRGRKNIFKNIANCKLLIADCKVVWFHCSSLGEFEQARPLVERLKMKNEKLKIIITFFSPSGYEIRKNYDKADFIFYLPMDTKNNVKRFLDIINPSIGFFVKYDFWYNYLNELYKRKTPAYLVSANFREEQFRGFYGKYLEKVLSFFDHIFVQNEFSQRLLVRRKITNVTVSGDLRYDMVFETASMPKKNSMVEHFKGIGKIIIAGSTWNQDEEIIANCKLQTANCKLIIAPHEINEEHIKKIISFFPDRSLRYSEISKEPVSSAMGKLQEAQVLIIDNIGMLSYLYQYADIAYIGGGFRSGIHNILEAAVFGVPVIFGPHHQKFPEANELIEHGGGFSVNDANGFKKAMDLLLSDEKILMMASMICKNFVSQRKGATEKVVSQVKIGI